MPRRKPSSRERGRNTGGRRRETGERRSDAGKNRRRASPGTAVQHAAFRNPQSKRVIRIHRGHPRLRFDRHAVAAAIHLLDLHAEWILGRNAPFRPSTFDLRHSTQRGPSPGELSLAFLTESALTRLHGSFFGDPTPTDVITFPGGPGSGQAGEICVSVDAARAVAGENARDFSGELTLYLVHGWLHLAGHDDRAPALKKRMRAAERRAMKLLRTANALPRFSLVDQA